MKFSIVEFRENQFREGHADELNTFMVQVPVGVFWDVVPCSLVAFWRYIPAVLVFCWQLDLCWKYWYQALSLP
jgi:hypothetical protein